MLFYKASRESLKKLGSTGIGISAWACDGSIEANLTLFWVGGRIQGDSLESHDTAWLIAGTGSGSSGKAREAASRCPRDAECAEAPGRAETCFQG